MSRRFSTIGAAAICLLLIAGGICAVMYYKTAVLPKNKLDESNEKFNEILDNIRPTEISGVGKLIDITDILCTDKKYDELHSRKALSDDPLSLCKNLNGETVAWLTIPDTHIDFPVMQCGDNDFYLHNGVDGSYNNEMGCPFLDYRCEGDFSGFNSIVYGHNMVDSMMFADVSLYSEESYFDDHAFGTLILPGEAALVTFFAYLEVPSDSPVYHTVFFTKSEQETYLDVLFAAAKYTKDCSAETLKGESDLHLLLLSTCTFQTEDSRGVLVGYY